MRQPVQRGPLFTVFTPTFNRAHTLSNVYRSLVKQTLREFEWIVVDDGSTDGTRELVMKWARRSSFEIRYIFQLNSGKHVAFNRAVEVAKGDFFLNLDSDDECAPEALETFKASWSSIPNVHREIFSGVTCLCKDTAGDLIGDRFPTSPFDEFPAECRRRRIRGEKWGFQRTVILRQFPFPVFPGEKFVPESLIWNRIGSRYMTRHINVALRIYHTGSDGLSSQSWRHRVMSPQGTLTYYQEAVQQLNAGWRYRYTSAVNFLRFSLHKGDRFQSIERRIGGKILFISAVVPGILAATIDKLVKRGD